MKFFNDTEFLEDGTRIYPISVGLVTEEGREFYRVYADWLCDYDTLMRVRNHRFLMTAVVPHLPVYAQQIVSGQMQQPMHTTEFDTHPLIVPRWRLALELEQFVSAYGGQRNLHELWSYYGAYDHVVLAQTFGTMMQLPQSVPMYTRELMQLEDYVNRQRVANGLPPVERPGKTGEHHALADAHWNRRFHQALVQADLGGCPETTALAWTIDEERDLVTVPSRVFVAGYERLESVGPNEGLDPEDEEPARRLWNALL
jgi:hypothetical protein